MILDQGKETVAVILNQKGTKMADSDQGKVDTYSKWPALKTLGQIFKMGNPWHGTLLVTINKSQAKQK